MLAQADVWILNEFNLLYYERMWTAILVAAWGQDCHECDRFPVLLQLRGVGDSTGESIALVPTVKLISQPSVDGPGETVRKNVEQILEEEMQRTRDLIREAAAQPSDQTAIVLQAPAADADNAADEAATAGAALFAQSPAPDQAALVAQHRPLTERRLLAEPIPMQIQQGMQSQHQIKHRHRHRHRLQHRLWLRPELKQRTAQQRMRRVQQRRGLPPRGMEVQPWRKRTAQQRMRRV